MASADCDAYLLLVHGADFVHVLEHDSCLDQADMRSPRMEVEMSIGDTDPSRRVRDVLQDSHLDGCHMDSRAQ